MGEFSSGRRDLQLSTATLALLLVVLLSLLGYQTLWLDEVIQLVGTGTGHLDHVDKLLKTGVGSVPLGWLPQLLLIRAFGYSPEVARLPSALASVASCGILYVTARALGIKHSVVPVLLLAALPLPFRYALEGRPYSLGLMVSCLSTLLILKRAASPTKGVGLGYMLVCSCAALTQPFAAFPIAGHAAWALRNRQSRPDLARLALGAVVCGCACFIPWYIYASPKWQQELGTVRFPLSWRIVPMLLRELTGAGYLGSALLLAAGWLGFTQSSLRREQRVFLAFCCGGAVLGPLAADAAFGYFVAIRQFIFALPPLILLASAWISERISTRRWIACATGASLVMFIVYDYRWITKPREDFAAAASAIPVNTGRSRECVLFAPATAADYYLFFRPDLANWRCEHVMFAPLRIVVVESPYAKQADLDLVSLSARLEGKSLRARTSVGLSVIDRYE